MTRKFTGWHVTAIFVAFFATVVAVNFGMAWAAVRGFGGAVVENSYVASQDYNRWIEEQRREDALGWSATISRDDAGRIVVATVGVPDDATVTAFLRRPLGVPEDRTVKMHRSGPARFTSPATERGRWIVRLEVVAGAKAWSYEARVE